LKVLSLLTALAGAVLATAAPAQTPGPARAALEHFSTGLESLHAQFTQRVLNPDGSLSEEGKGETWLQRPNLFRWAYEGEFPELIVADGERVWLYDQSLEQVTVKPQSGLAADSPLMVLTDLSGLDGEFNVAELGDDSGLALLELTSKNSDSQFERVLLGFAANTLKLMVLEDAFGNRTEIRFSSVERNAALDPSLFRFQVPEGVDVIGDTGQNLD